MGIEKKEEVFLILYDPLPQQPLGTLHMNYPFSKNSQSPTPDHGASQTRHHDAPHSLLGHFDTNNTNFIN